MPDLEIDAMSNVHDALEPLDDAARARVLRWAADKFEVTLAAPTFNGSVDRARGLGEGQQAEDDEDLDDEEVASSGSGAGAPAVFHHFAELFDAVQPKTDMEKAITAAYWEQTIRGRPEWQSQALNKELKDLGHYLSAINKALSSGMTKKPALVLQLKKTGAAQQGRKTYKLSAEGLKFIRSRISQNA